MDKNKNQIDLVDEIEKLSKREKVCGAEAFYNGFVIKGKYSVFRDEKGFGGEIEVYEKNRDHLDEIIIILNRKGESKEVRMQGIFKRILIGEWQ